MIELDRSVPVPIYYQLKMLLLDQIKHGVLRPGDKIPTEAALCEQYHISRTPVRQALLELTREGVLTRKAGRGTFVAAPTDTRINLRVIIPDERWQWPLEEALRVANDSQPQAQITLRFSTVPLSQLHDTLALAVAQGDAPDISVLDSVWINEFAHRRYLYAVDDLDAVWASRLRNDLYPSVLSANSYEGKPYAVPTNADVTVLWYRRDWFAAEGVQPPRTWEDLLAVGRHFRQPEVRRRYGLGAHPLIFAAGRSGGETTTYQLLPFLWSANADVISDAKVVLDSPATRRGLAFLHRLVHGERIASPVVVREPWNGPLCAFAHGEVAMAFGGTYENFMIQQEASWDEALFLERVGFTPLPAGAGSTPASLVGGMTYGIYRQSRHPVQALELLKRALNPDVLKAFSLRTGQNAAYLSVARTIQANENGFLSRVAPLFDHARSRPPLLNYDLVSRRIQEMVEAALSDELPIDVVVRRTAERISGITGLPVA